MQNQALIRALVLASWCFAAGCVVPGVRQDQDRLRTALLDLYTNQIVDNLIRASNGLPIVQIEYTNATTQLTLKDSAGFSDALATSHPSVLRVAAGATSTVLKSIANTAAGTLNVDRTNQVSLTGTPVTAGDDVYNAYRDFLAIPGSLQITDQPPPDGAAHVCRCWSGRYYWVPADYQKAFLLLSLSTTAQRGKSAAPLDAFFTANIVDVLRAENLGNPNPELPSNHALIVKLDKKIPVDTGSILIDVGDLSLAPPKPTGGANAAGSGSGDASNAGGSAGSARKGAIRFRITGYQTDAPASQQATDTITIAYDTAAGKQQGVNDYEALITRIRAYPLPVSVFLARHRPQAPMENDSMSRIEFSLQQIQFNQTRLGAGP